MLLALVLAVALGVAVAWVTPTGMQSCADGIDLTTGERFGRCDDLRWNMLAGARAFLIAFVALSVTGLVRRRRRRQRRPAADDGDAARAQGR